MNCSVIAKSVMGASHKRTGKPCQDRNSVETKRKKKNQLLFEDGTVIVAIADGHGSDSAPYSDVGAGTAVNVFCDVMAQFHESYAENLNMLMTYLNREGEVKVAQTIDSEWKRRVFNYHTMKKREVQLLENGEKNKAEVYKQYGATLLGLMITSEFLFAFQLGDGDIAYIDDGGAELVIEPEKILGVETHSLSREASWKKAITLVRRFEADASRPLVFTLTSDGFANSYKDEESFKNTLVDYFGMLKEHGAQVIEENLEAWLTETSEFGCGDDITLLMVYFPLAEKCSSEVHEESEASNDEGIE